MSSHELFSYDPLARSWRLWLTQGDIPPMGLGTSCTFVESENTLYVFGGQHGYPEEEAFGRYFIEGNNCEVYSLNMVTKVWTHLKSGSDKTPYPCEKSLIAFHNGFVYAFGGYCEIPEEELSTKVKLDPDPGSPYHWKRGWSACLNRFNPKLR